MTDGNIFKLNKPEQNDPLQEVLREGARKMLTAAIESEVAAFIQQHRGLKSDEGKTAAALPADTSALGISCSSCVSSTLYFAVADIIISTKNQ